MSENTLKLPAPDADSAAHSHKVALHIRQRIAAAGGDIGFGEYMQLALYASGLGYYVAGARKFGADGDFVTAPEISVLFGRILADQVAGVLGQVSAGQVLEIGAGTGALAVTMLRRLSELGCLPEKYLILEISADLQERQQQRLQEEIPDFVSRVAWLDRFPQQFCGAMIANEVIDALPVERFRCSDGNYQQCTVRHVDGRFTWGALPATDKLADAIRKVEQDIDRTLEDGYVSELALAVPPWLAELQQCLQSGFIFLFDYGVSRREYYAEDRNSGWLRCHYRHRAHDDPFIYPGIQDLTAWVDFTAVADAAAQNGLRLAGYVSQAQFLLGGGLQESLEGFTELSIERQARISREVKMLTLPGEMGENFKCMGLSKGNIVTPGAFSRADRRHAL